MFQPTMDRITVRPLDVDEKSAGGIILSERSQSRTQQGEVVAVGNGVISNMGNPVPVRLAVGATVTFMRGSGIEVKSDGESLLLLREGDVLGVEV